MERVLGELTRKVLMTGKEGQKIIATVRETGKRKGNRRIMIVMEYNSKNQG